MEPPPGSRTPLPPVARTASGALPVVYQAHLLLRRIARHSVCVLVACSSGRMLQRQHDLGGAPMLGTRRHVLGSTAEATDACAWQVAAQVAGQGARHQVLGGSRKGTVMRERSYI